MTVLDLQPTALISRELRPSRVALLVDPGDLSRVRDAIAWASTCWGGAYWPLVPVFRQRPRWWGRSASGSLPSVASITAGYLERYDPDWVISFVDDYEPPVMADRMGAVDDWGLQGARTERAADLLLPIVEELHERRFRFVEHRPPECVIHFPTIGPLLADAMLGRCGSHRVQAEVAAELGNRLSAEHRDLTPDLLRRLQLPNRDDAEVITPLELGTDGFLFRHYVARSTYVYFCSLRRSWDALDLWNLRAAGDSVFVCPLEWADALEETVNWLLARADTAAVGARRLTAREKAVAEDRAAVHRKTLYAPPVYWDPNGQPNDRPARVVATHDVVQVPVVDGRLDVGSLDPPWAHSRRTRFMGAWVNEVEIHDDQLRTERAGVVPHDLSSIRPFHDHAFLSRPIRLSEGRLVVGHNRPGGSVNVRIPTGYDIAEGWLAERGHRSKLSEPGRIVREMARKLQGVSIFRTQIGMETMHLLNRGTRQQHLKAQQVRSALRDDGAPDPDARLFALTQGDVLRAGLVVQCPRCVQQNFVIPDDLARTLRCERCLETFGFPEHRPPRSWGYRPAGPFAVEDFARGAYAALFAIAALASDPGRSVTWSPSLEVEALGELDLLLWLGEWSSIGPEKPPDLILGEAKTYDKFAEHDVERLVRARERLGDGWLCFATLREGITDDERTLLASAAAQLTASGDHPPLIILTRAELTSRSLTEELNRSLRELNAQEIALWRTSTEELATATQRVHLGLTG